MNALILNKIHVADILFVFVFMVVEIVNCDEFLGLDNNEGLFWSSSSVSRSTDMSLYYIKYR